nr:immunoglobulin heavy chain junction region [Homo sapiens]
CATSGGGHW